MAYFSQSGLHGEIHFSSTLDNTVLIETNLEVTLQYPEQSWSWGIHSNPVDYTTIDAKERCTLNAVGSQFLNFDDDLGFLILPGNESTSWEKNFNMTGLFIFDD